MIKKSGFFYFFEGKFSKWVKDSRGFMWFGTENGLYRYDGYEFKSFHYDPDDSTSISGNMIWDIMLEDNECNLWISTKASGLNIYNPYTETFTHFNRDPDFLFDFDFNLIRWGLQDKDGDIWLASEITSGLIYFDKITGTFITYRPNKDTIGSNANRISAIYEDRKGNLWIGTYQGLYNFNKETKTFSKLGSFVNIPEELNNNHVSSIFEDREGIIWIGTETELLKYNAEKKKIYRFNIVKNDQQNLYREFIIKIYDNPVDGGRSIWIVTNAGINKFEKSPEVITRFNKDPADPKCRIFDGMFDLFLDDNGMLWVGSGFAGAVRHNLNMNPFSGYQIGPFDQDPYLYEATVFLHDKSGYLWVGIGSSGLLKYDENMNLISRYIHSPDNPNSISNQFVYSLFEDSDGVLWVGTSAGLDVFDKKHNRFIHCSLPSEFNYEYIRINDICQDKYGILWIVTSGGVYYQDKQEVLDTSFLNVPEFAGKLMEVRCITEDAAGNVWFGSTISGLYLLTPENRKTMTFINYKHDPEKLSSISDDIVWSAYVDYNSVLWLGTTNGLNKFDPISEKFYCFNMENGLDANFIYFIEGDNNGNLWLSTEKGIIRFTQLTDSTAHSKLLERADGLPFDGNYHYKLYKGKEGKIYIGGRLVSGNGFYCFHPDSLKDNTNIPPVVLTELLVNNKSYKPDSSITEINHLQLQHNQNFFSIKFAALDFVNPSKNNYAYKLEGFDEDWIYCNNRRLANYTNVPPGDYIFRAKGSNNDGLWNEQGASLKITIFPPPWKTWWAYSLYLLFIILILIIVIRYYLRRQRLLHELALEQVQTEKLEEMDRLKSRFFANISHEFRTPLTLIMGPLKKLRTQISEEAKKDLDMMQRNAQRLQNLINQLLSLSKLESGKMKLQAQEVNIVSLVNSYMQSFESLAKQKKIELIFGSTEENIQLYVDKDKIEKILYNLLSNAFKFTGEGGRIEISITPLNPLPMKNRDRLSRGDLLLADPFSKRSAKSPPFRGDGRGVQIKITDTGPGIPPNKLPHIFDRFYQADDSYSKDQEGTGIGLALTKELVELHHGEITVQSDVGKGTAFTVTLPLDKEHLQPDEIGGKNGISNTEHRILNVEVIESEDLRENTAEKKILNLDPQRSTFDTEAKPLLLLVEDNSDLRSYICDYLDESYQVIEAVDGKEGLEQALEQIPDLVISDVMMPKMDGYEFCRKLKTDERTSHIPVILLTAKAAMEDKLEGLETGADDFLTKPFDPQELLVRISNLIRQREKLKEKYKSRFVFAEEKEHEEILSSDDKFLQKAGQFVEQYLADPGLSVERFAQHMAMSQSQLYRKLKALIDLSPNEFIRTIRLQRAAELLTRRSGNIAEIAYDVGFNNPSYFSECFQKQFGKLPSEY